MEMTAGAGTFLLAGETGGLLGTDLRVLVPVGGVGSLGVEVGRRYGGGVESYLDHAAALWRFAVAPRLSVDVGPEVHFGPANAVGLLGVVLLHLPVNSMVDIPFGLHADAVYTRDAAFARHFFIMTSLAVGVGVRF